MDTKVLGGSRLPWIDWAKALGIFLVIYGHAPASGHIFIYMFHMPFFFMLSGYLYKRANIKNEIKKSFKSLILPYFIYNVILLIITFILGNFKLHMIYDILLGNQEGIGIKYFNPLWFLISLFIMRIVSSLFSETKLICLGCLCILTASILYHFQYFSYNNDYFQLCTTLICYPFFIGGFVIKNKNIKIQFPLFKTNFLSIIIFLVSGGFLLLLGYNNGFVNIFRATQAGNSIVIFYLVGFLLSYMIICIISTFLNRSSAIIETISSGTVLILALHRMFLLGIIYNLPKNNFTAITVSILVMIICYPLIVLSKKYFHAIIGHRG